MSVPMIVRLCVVWVITAPPPRQSYLRLPQNSNLLRLTEHARIKADAARSLLHCYDRNKIQRNKDHEVILCNWKINVIKIRL